MDLRLKERRPGSDFRCASPSPVTSPPQSRLHTSALPASAASCLSVRTVHLTARENEGTSGGTSGARAAATTAESRRDVCPIWKILLQGGWGLASEYPAPAVLHKQSSAPSCPLSSGPQPSSRTRVRGWPIAIH